MGVYLERDEEESLSYFFCIYVVFLQTAADHLEVPATVGCFFQQLTSLRHSLISVEVISPSPPPRLPHPTSLASLLAYTAGCLSVRAKGKERAPLCTMAEENSLLSSSIEAARWNITWRPPELWPKRVTWGKEVYFSGKWSSSSSCNNNNINR